MSSTFRHVGKNISNNADSHFIYFKNEYTGSFECEAEEIQAFPRRTVTS